MVNIFLRPKYRVVKETYLDICQFRVDKLLRLFGLIPLFWDTHLYDLGNGRYGKMYYLTQEEAIEFIDSKLRDYRNKLNKLSIDHTENTVYKS